MTFEDYSDRDARLCILRELSRQIDNRANERLINAMLSSMGYSRSLDWVRTQLRKLEELGAVRIHMGGEIMVAEIRRAGLDHVERRSVIEGVAKPTADD